MCAREPGETLHDLPDNGKVCEADRATQVSVLDSWRRQPTSKESLVRKSDLRSHAAFCE